MKKKAIIFDLDGTLLDTILDLAYATNLLLSAHHYPVHSISSYREWVGDGAAMQIGRALPENPGDGLMQELLQEYLAIYARNCTRETRLFPGIDRLLDFLSLEGLPVSILTNKPHDLTLKVTAHYLSRWKFFCVQGLVADYPRKPHPGRVFEIAEKLGLNPADIALIGDSDTDMQTGRAAGTLTIGVTWGYDTREALQEYGADLIVSDPEELITLLKSGIHEK